MQQSIVESIVNADSKYKVIAQGSTLMATGKPIDNTDVAPSEIVRKYDESKAQSELEQIKTNIDRQENEK